MFTLGERLFVLDGLTDQTTILGEIGSVQPSFLVMAC